MNEHYLKWTSDRAVEWLATNFKSEALPFQGWQKFKEAFAPEIVALAIDRSPNKVETILDPFGGSGTSALTGQFLGRSSITIEVNPYLADVIESKLFPYDPVQLTSEVQRFLLHAHDALKAEVTAPANVALPRSFVEPGNAGRWLFSAQTYTYLANILNHADSLSPEIRRLVRTSVGGDLVAISNAYVSGKGRRYRKNWEERQHTPHDAYRKIEHSLSVAMTDILEHLDRPRAPYSVIRGDSREAMRELNHADLVIFSPPYPNSFDYTDVYNIELWVLGYLGNATDNSHLRLRTLNSHVQVAREFPQKPTGSPSLEKCLLSLEAIRDSLWNRNIPEMIGGYFADMKTLLEQSARILPVGGQCWMVVGDSRYRGVDVPVASIIPELAREDGFKLVESTTIRTMRTAPQQGGQSELPETLIVLEKSSAT